MKMGSYNCKRIYWYALYSESATVTNFVFVSVGPDISHAANFVFVSVGPRYLACGPFVFVFCLSNALIIYSSFPIIFLFLFETSYSIFYTLNFSKIINKSNHFFIFFPFHATLVYYLSFTH